MTNAWNRAQSLADKHASQGGIFVRLENDGDKIVGAFCGDPHPREVIWTGEGYEPYDEDNPDHKGKRPALKVAINFFVPGDGMKIYEGGTRWFQDLLKVREKYGLDNWTFEIERKGAKGDTKTKYTLLPEDKIDAALRAQIAAAELHDLANMMDDGAESTPATVSESEVESFASALRKMPRPAVDYFLAELGVQRIRDVRAGDADRARELLRELEAKHAPAPSGEVDPFA